MDGGLRSNLSADRVRDYDRVVAFSCLPLPTPGAELPWDPMIASMAGTVNDELDLLLAGGAAVELVEPRAEFLAISRNGMRLGSFSGTAEAFAAGERQASLELDRIRAIWGA